MARASEGLLIVSMGSDFNALNCLAWSNLGASYPIADDRGSAIWNDFGSGAVPRNVILDSEGVVHYSSIGFNETAITAILDDLLQATGTSEEIASPETHSLITVFPNPFNAETQIQFELPTEGFVSLSIYDGQGREVRSLIASELDPGIHQTVWNSRDNAGAELPSGVYIARLAHQQGQASQKVLLVK